MRSDIKAKWLSALRSGEYQQGTGTLSAEGKYCCLGVLCEIAVEAGVVEKAKRPASHETSYGVNVTNDPFMGSQSYLPSKVAEWAELSDRWGQPDQNPTVTHPDDEHVTITLSDLNDGGKTFADIADAIEANF